VPLAKVVVNFNKIEAADKSGIEKKMKTSARSSESE